MKTGSFSIVVFLMVAALTACDDQTWNNPHNTHAHNPNTLYASFSESPKTLDPARAYSSDESVFTGAIYEPPLQYHYLKRPYILVPLTAVNMPQITYIDKSGNKLPKNTPNKMIAYTIYDIYIKPGIYYQPHPAFAKDKQGRYIYHNLTAQDLDDIHVLSDFSHTGTRELTADDYVYEIKRLAQPSINSPILGFMEKYIVGLTDYSTTLRHAYDELVLRKPKHVYVDLRKFPLQGAKTISRYHYRITVNGKYPQFEYWFAMPFFAPIPWEVDYFYSQPEMSEKNLTFDWYPVGTGPYMLVENNPNKQMVLKKNPNFHEETYPAEGEFVDKAMGFLEEAGKPLPFIDEVVFSLEKETIPRWTKFLQGYYDLSGVASDSFDQAIYVDEMGNAQLTPAMEKKGIVLQSSVTPSVFYLGFNMIDDVVGGNSERARKLRIAISSAVDYQEFINIFLNGSGVVANGPIPPGIFGYQKVEMKGQSSLKKAQQLLVEAGYPGGLDSKTGIPLILYYDVSSSSGPDDKARFDWMRKQFEKLGIQLRIRATQYNRFQEKMRTGHAQLFSLGWIADYPDPENFLFLLYSKNGKVKYGGENAANYENSEFDRLFDMMKQLPNVPRRQIIINKMLAILNHDMPWVWGFHPKGFMLSHQWNHVNKPNLLANNTLKYQRLEPKLRRQLRKEWNKLQWWPFVVLSVLLLLVMLIVLIGYWRREHGIRLK